MARTLTHKFFAPKLEKGKGGGSFNDGRGRNLARGHTPGPAGCLGGSKFTLPLRVARAVAVDLGRNGEHKRE